MMLGLREGLRIYRRARRLKREGFRAYSGTSQEQCRAIIKDAYDTQRGYFRVSSGHFCEFYARDFAWCAPALVQLGYNKEVFSTLRYALSRYRNAGAVTTMITPDGDCYDFPTHGPDALALLLDTIVAVQAKVLAREYMHFLQGEVDRFITRYVDLEQQLPRSGRFTSMRDHAGLDRSCYNACMIAITARACAVLGLRFPLTFDAIKKKIIATYWNGTYFFSDLHKQNIVVGDANVVPFWFGVVSEKNMMRKAFDAIHAAKLDEPFPLKYVSTQDKRREKSNLHLANLLTPDYETDSTWMHMGIPYVRLLASIDKKRAISYTKKYTENLKKHSTFLELYDRNGKPYTSAFYVTDEAMLWCAPYLALAKELKVLV